MTFVNYTTYSSLHEDRDKILNSNQEIFTSWLFLRSLSELMAYLEHSASFFSPLSTPQGKIFALRDHLKMKSKTTVWCQMVLKVAVWEGILMN